MQKAINYLQKMQLVFLHLLESKEIKYSTILSNITQSLPSSNGAFDLYLEIILLVYVNKITKSVSVSGMTSQKLELD